MVTPDGKSNKRPSPKERVDRYLAPVYAAPLEDERPLSVRAVMKALKIGYDTLEKHSLLDAIEAAEKFRDSERRRVDPDSVSGSRISRQLKEAQKNAAEWERKYKELLEVNVNLTYAITSASGVDAEAILGSRLPKAVRHQPGKGRRRK